VHLLESSALDKHLPGDWRSRCAQIVRLRRAFDAADIDGDLSIAQDELELVLLANDPSQVPARRAAGPRAQPVGVADGAATQTVGPDDVARVWRLLNPTAGPSVSWLAFLQAMPTVKRDAEATRLMAIDQPNRWALIRCEMILYYNYIFYTKYILF
jgi:hypothetical protein